MIQAKNTHYFQNLYEITQNFVASWVALAENPVMTLKELVLKVREQTGYTQSELGDAIDADGQTISNIETGVTRTMKRSRLRKLAEVAKIPVEDVLKIARDSAVNGDTHGRDAAQFLRDKGIDPEPQPRRTKTVSAKLQGHRFVGRVQCGGMVEADSDEHREDQERTNFVDERYPEAVALKIVGDSMLPDFRPGEIIICQKINPDQMEVGKFVVIQCGIGNDGRATFKQVVGREGDEVLLKPLNGKHKPLRCKLDDVARVLVCVGQYMPR